jgi:hypothetical protein
MLRSPQLSAGIAASGHYIEPPNPGNVILADALSRRKQGFDSPWGVPVFSTTYLICRFAGPDKRPEMQLNAEAETRLPGIGNGEFKSQSDPTGSSN